MHAPLVFDLVDTWNERALGGCVYHVAHPGGRHFETFPVNAYEAEGRRLARFFASVTRRVRGARPAEDRNPDFPLTLDLRRPPSHTLTARGRPTNGMIAPTLPEFRGPVAVAPARGLSPSAGATTRCRWRGAQPRPHCETLVRSLEALGRHELASRWEERQARDSRQRRDLQRLRRSRKGVDRPWTLDMMPLLIEPAEWSRIEGAALSSGRGCST